MNGLSLFSGAGIGELAFKYILPDYRTVGYVEWDRYCCGVIEARIRDEVLDEAPIFEMDIRDFNGRFAGIYTGAVDFISAGFPCQPFSVAGNRVGEDDPRNQWPETLRCISIVRPRYVFLENVPGLLAHEYVRTIFGELATIRYDSEWGIASAASVGAPHLRKRLWILSHAIDGRCDTGSQPTRRETGTDFDRCSAQTKLADSQKQPERPRLCENKPSEIRRGRFSDGSGETISDTNRNRCDKARSDISEAGGNGFVGNDWWSIEPDVGRVAHGVARRVDRLKALGNGWVPQVVAAILRADHGGI